LGQAVTRAALALLACLLALPSAALPLWQLQGRGGRVWLLGSVHSLRPADHPLPAAIDTAVAAAQVIYLELDLDDPAVDPAATAAELATDPRGRDLRKLLGRSAWRDARRRAAALGINLETLRPYEPWYAALAISRLRLLQLGFDGEHGVESHVVQAAGAAGKEIRGLETLAGQLAALDGLPLRVQRRFLAATLTEAAGMDDRIADLVSAWQAGDNDALAGSLLEGAILEREVYQRVIVDRNRRFLATIRSLADEGPDSLVVVGALHLVGDDGVVAALQAEGYMLRPVD
jgi:uncharacterized protein YbaP (TraB family)